MECANEVIRYLGQAQGFSDDTKCRVINHLASCIQLANTKAKALQVSALAAKPQPATVAATMNTNVPAAAAATVNLAGGALVAPPTAVSANGQIIHIVNGPPPAMTAAVPAAGKPQNVHILPSPPTATTVLSNNINMAAASHTNNSSARPAISVPAAPQHQIQPSSHYSQPLHIHIPPAFSPVLVGKAERISVSGLRPASSHKQQHQQQTMDMDISPRLACPEQSPAKSGSSTGLSAGNGAFLHTGNPQSQAAQCSVLTTTPDSTPSPQARLPSPVMIPRQHQQKPEQHQQADTPITHVHKIHGFYSSADDFVPSRPRTYSVTSSSSTSSSSSSSSAENELLPSPLNLSSQSPTSSFNFHPKKMSKGGEPAPKPRHFMDKNNNINISNNKNIASSYSSDQENLNNSGNPHVKNAFRGESYCPSQPFSSVMLNARGKSGLDSDVTPAFKYMSMMMEEDRQCTRNHGHRSRSTSPASSVGEDRLWRPW